MEIKPLSPSGLIAAEVQMALRAVQFLGTGYTPDTIWHTTPSVIYPWGIPTIFFNVAGVLFYTDVIEVAYDYVAIRTLSAVWGLLNSGRLAYTVEVALTRIAGLVKVAIAGGEAERATFSTGDSLLGAFCLI